ncbi:MAG: hypothetical protein J6Z14_08590 [Prevotella sp.]|nr:hypothetical protein [Prevotella sp.]
MRMKRKMTVLMACLFCLAAATPVAAQEEENKQDNIDWTEDTTEVKTIKDIIEEQQKVTLLNAAERHYADVWGRRSYMNVGYSTSELKPDGVADITGKLPTFKSSWGVMYQYGRNYRLHKKPIANAIQFNIDYTGVDLNVNHYDEEGNGTFYNSSIEYIPKDGKEADKFYHYTPWRMEKYEASFCMWLGPSVTFAPFNGASSRGIHYLKFNVYYHFGYQFSALFMKFNDDKDVNKNGSTNVYKNYFEDVDDALTADWAHGMTTSFGVNLSWKAIGIGYEHRSSKLKYKSFATSVFSGDKFEFDSSINRIYLQYRM